MPHKGVYIKKLLLSVALLLLFQVAPSRADVLSWTPGSTSTTGYTYTSAEIASMAYNVRVDKPNSQDGIGASGFNLSGTWYLIGQTSGGITQWPSTGDFTNLLISYGLGGQAVQVTVSQVFTDVGGPLESGLGTPIVWKSDPTSPFADTFSPGNGATGTPVGTASFSFHYKDQGINATGADSANLWVNCPNFGGTKTCASGLVCTGTTADWTVIYPGLSLGYDNVISCSIYGQDLFSPPNTMNQYYSFTVQPSTNPALSITTVSLPNGTRGSVYSGGPITATGGHSPYGFAVLSGTLPTGLSLSPSGVPTGTPTTTGTFSFTVRATDALGATADKAFSITVYPAIPITGTALDNTDTFINSGSPTVNYADNTWLKTYVWPTVPANIIFVKRTTSGIPDNQVVTKYVYRLYLIGYDGSGGTNPLIHQYGPVTGAFAIDNVTWANFTGVYGAALGTVSVSLVPGWFDFNVTALAQAAYLNGKSDFSFYISPIPGVQDSNRIFASSSYADNNLRPQTIITTVPIVLPPSTVSPPTPPTPPPPAPPSIQGICRAAGSNCLGTSPGGANYLGPGKNYLK